MEILSPVGSPDSLVAAIKGGCDAVYLAGKSFGARSFAKNFNNHELEGAIGYAHDHKIKVYVAVNTLIKNSEIESAVSQVRFLHDVGADAVIIQDLGLLNCIYSIDIPKHASTQLQIHSHKGLEWCYENNICRAVLARELTLKELSQVINDSPIETEVFIQGAMCYCMSGGCFMSSFIGGRSGNRGMCAQPCRKKYTINNNDGYFMSCADICDTQHIETLNNMGISSLKIEGRMRSPAYIYLSTKVCSMARDGNKGKDFDDAMRLLKTVFNRGTCSGYFDGLSKSPVQSLYPDNHGLYISNAEIKNRIVKLMSGTESVRIGDGISIFNNDEKMGGFIVNNLDPIYLPFSIRDGIYQIYRTYDPKINQINNMISKSPKLVGNTLKKISHVRFNKHPSYLGKYNPKISFYLSTIRAINLALPYVDRIYFDDIDKMDEAFEICKLANIECVALLPRFDPLDKLIDTNYPVMVNNPGQQLLYKRSPRIYCSNIMNMFNSFFPLRIYQSTISVELSHNEINDVIKNYNGRVEVMIFGRTELMYTRDPEMSECTIIDKKRARFPVYRDERNFQHVLNSADLYLLDKMSEIKQFGASSFGLDLRMRPLNLVEAVGKMCKNPTEQTKNKIINICGHTTHGLYYRGV